MNNGFEAIQQSGKERMDSAIDSMNAINRGMQAFNSTVVEYTKTSFEESIEATEKLLGVRSLERAFEVQGELIKGAYENYLSRTTRLGEILVEMTQDAFRSYDFAPAKKGAAQAK